MPEPNEYQVLTLLQARLQAISVAGGYYYSVDDAAVKLNPAHAAEALKAPSGPRPIVILSPAEDAFQFFPANQTRLTMNLVIYWVHESDARDDADKLKTFYRGCFDIEKALAPSSNGTVWFGALATDARVKKRALDDTLVDRSQVCAVIEVEIVVNRTVGT